MPQRLKLIAIFVKGLLPFFVACFSLLGVLCGESKLFCEESHGVGIAPTNLPEAYR
jgi:hypothetical protein